MTSSDMCDLKDKIIHVVMDNLCTGYFVGFLADGVCWGTRIVRLQLGIFWIVVCIGQNGVYVRLATCVVSLSRPLDYQSSFIASC